MTCEWVLVGDLSRGFLRVIFDFFAPGRGKPTAPENRRDDGIQDDDFECQAEDGQ